MTINNENTVVVRLSEDEAKFLYKELDDKCEFGDEDCPVLYNFYKELEDVL